MILRFKKAGFGLLLSAMAVFLPLQAQAEGSLFEFPADVTLPRPKLCNDCGDGYGAGTQKLCVVDGVGRHGRAKTIQQCVRRTAWGGKIEVHPHPNGSYVENIKITRAVTIEGVGGAPNRRVVVRPATGAEPCLQAHLDRITRRSGHGYRDNYGEGKHDGSFNRDEKAAEGAPANRDGAVVLRNLLFIRELGGEAQTANCVDVRAGSFTMTGTVVTLYGLFDDGTQIGSSHGVTAVSVNARDVSIGGQDPNRDKVTITGADVGLGIVGRERGKQRVENAELSNNAVGLKIAGSGEIDVTNNYIYSNRDVGIDVIGPETFTAPPFYSGFAPIVEQDTTYAVRIKDGNYVGANGLGIRLVNWPWEFNNNITISGNRIDGNSGAGILFTLNRCERIKPSVSEGVSITQNLIINNRGSAYEWLGQGKPKKRWFPGNTLDNNDHGEWVITFPRWCQRGFVSNRSSRYND